MSVKPIQIEAYDPQWPVKFVGICSSLKQNLGAMIGEIHHVGSTAVPGLAAKAVIDIDVILKDFSLLDRAIELLGQSGYRYEGERGITGRHAFRYLVEGGDSHHLYICDPQSVAFKNHICLRDFLRNNQEATKRYAQLKRQLAKSHPYNMEAYVEGKTAFITGILAEVGVDELALALIKRENINNPGR